MTAWGGPAAASALGADLLDDEPAAPGVAVAVVSGGDVREVVGFGRLATDRDEPVGPGTMFHAASVSKLVCAVGVLRLVAEGRLDLDEDVDDRLRSWQLRDRGARSAPVTLRALLSHHAGVIDPDGGFGPCTPGKVPPTSQPGTTGTAGSSRDDSPCTPTRQRLACGRRLLTWPPCWESCTPRWAVGAGSASPGSWQAELVRGQGPSPWAGLGAFVAGPANDVRLTSLGWGVGFQCALRAYPHRGDAVLVMTNCDPGRPQEEALTGRLVQAVEWRQGWRARED